MWGMSGSPQGLNGGLKALLFDFEELLLWNVATMDEPAWDPPVIGVDLSSAEPEALPSTRAEDPLGLKGTDSAIPDPMATSSQVSPHAVMPENIPSILQVSHFSSLPNVPNLQRWPASLPLHSLRLPPELTQLTSQMRCFDCQGRWMWPWSGCSQLRPPWTPVKDSWHWMPISPCTKMSPGYWGHQRGWNALKRDRGLLCNHDQGGGGLPCHPCLCLGTIPQGKHATVGVWGDSRGRVGLPNICGGLWGSLVGLSTWSPWGTNVSHAAPYW